jgi:hypothetical protein
MVLGRLVYLWVQMYEKSGNGLRCGILNLRLGHEKIKFIGIVNKLACKAFDWVEGIIIIFLWCPPNFCRRQKFGGRRKRFPACGGKPKKGFELF